VTHRNLIALAAVALLAFAGNAMATDVVYYAGDIWAGQTTDVGTITATMNCTSSDTSLVIAYQTTGGWRMTECHVWIGTATPPSRGAPGKYPYKSGSINTTSYSFSIPIADLRSTFGIDWGEDVYVMPHCAVYKDANNNQQYNNGEQTETGYGGCIHKPKKGSWFGYFGFGLTKPNEEPRQPYTEVTYSCGYWINFWSPTEVSGQPWHTDEDVLEWLGNGTEVIDGVTLAGTNFKTAADLYDTYVQGSKYYYWFWFMEQFVSLYCNTCVADGLEEAYYDNPNLSGELMEGKQISYIMGVANGYRYGTTPEATYSAMANGPMFDINHNSDEYLGVLWDGPQGRPVPLGQTARLTVSPNPFTGSTRIRLQNGLQSEATVSVYDVSGKKVNELTCNQVWNGTDARGRKLAAGVYLLKLVSGTRSVSARAVISR
jgi:hypothetical protein